MTRFQLNRSPVRALALLFVTVLLAVGCSQSPLEVESSESAPQLLSRAPSQSPGYSLSPTSLYAEAVIPADRGGELVLFDVKLEVPAGAVGSDTLFSIRIPDPYVFYNEFGTDGLVFAKPVRVTMSYRDADLSGVDETTIRIAWYNESTGEFEDVACELDTLNKLVTAELHHFSAYGLISD
jgi:hypothetical protein